MTVPPDGGRTGGVMNGIELKEVTKNFGNVCALNKVSLTFRPNCIYGLLGRNGAGKSTMLNIITNRLFADEGTVTVDGEPAAENDTAQRKIYLMSEKNLYPEGLRIRDIFQYTSEFYPDFDKGYANKLAGLFGLDITKKVKNLSTGYASIFKLIIALSVNTPYVFFDEPVLGLDANHRELFYKLLIERYANHPAAYVISTHLIEEVSSIIEEIVIIKNGSIIKNESCESLLSKGYTITGPAASVERYCIGLDVIGRDQIGGLATAYLMGKPDKSRMTPDLEITRLDLQKLFIELTNA